MLKYLLFSVFFSVSMVFSQTNIYEANQNVGIGITNPIEKLHVNGRLRLEAHTSGAGVWHNSSVAGLQWFSGLNPDGDYRIYKNGNLFLINKTGNVGIGIDNPSQKLDVLGNIYLNSASASSSNNKVNSSGVLFKSSGYATDNRTRYQLWNILSIGNSIWGAGDLVFRSNTDGMGYKEMVRFSANGNVGIGTDSPDAKLTVKGNIHAQEVKVDLAGAVAPDYVFLKDYQLKTLDEVDNYIQVNGHLPNIPSAAIMEKEGVKLKEMNLKLLEKIEELTLYMIAQEKKIKQQKTVNNELNIKTTDLDNRLSELEKIIKTLKN
ncbi:hypothetical protein ACE939_10985 [Aquimarina sp. W85]|uniref:hypothetical protein n=1 Tax=Aquimarina rhodophyticola TaxID=3342246 RepID=UPI00366D1126